MYLRVPPACRAHRAPCPALVGSGRAGGRGFPDGARRACDRRGRHERRGAAGRGLPPRDRRSGAGPAGARPSSAPRVAVAAAEEAQAEYHFDRAAWALRAQRAAVGRGLRAAHGAVVDQVWHVSLVETRGKSFLGVSETSTLRQVTEAGMEGRVEVAAGSIPQPPRPANRGYDPFGGSLFNTPPKTPPAVATRHFQANQKVGWVDAAKDALLCAAGLRAGPQACRPDLWGYPVRS